MAIQPPENKERDCATSERNTSSQYYTQFRASYADGIQRQPTSRAKFKAPSHPQDKDNQANK